ncbi:MAG: hypothetical protein A3G25_20810 [Betaproteobacteria bacterium RIFCSPLOWO2_12_FULL_63_13]|nr:MAG: hypothetical protein A3G25_20810 [Betaproteobacteria bacterium RIFCSPLOWO2_12_FULL_63_13]
MVEIGGGQTAISRRARPGRAHGALRIVCAGCGFARAAVREVEHHLAHLGSAFLVSPFDEAVAVSVDGFCGLRPTGKSIPRIPAW